MFIVRLAICGQLYRSATRQINWGLKNINFETQRLYLQNIGNGCRHDVVFAIVYSHSKGN